MINDIKFKNNNMMMIDGMIIIVLVPYWASKSNGCMTSMMEGMTVTYLPESPAIQLIKECSPGVSKNVTCKGNMVCCLFLNRS